MQHFAQKYFQLCVVSLLTKHLTLEHSQITFTSVCVKQLSITITNARAKQLKKKVKVCFYSVLKVSVHRQSDPLLLILWQCLCGSLWKHRCSPFSSWAAEREKVEGPGFQYSFFWTCYSIISRLLTALSLNSSISCQWSHGPGPHILLLMVACPYVTYCISSNI